MNELERAINLLKHRAEIIRDMIAYNMNFEPKSDNSSLEEQKKAMDVAISSLEKQIPKKRYIKFPCSYCPTCNENITDESPNYCPNCGQSIDWSVEE
ncbi:MAG: hypothetical protein K0S47_3178 [Herbinix sp.]|jgi:predicted RNA-binding Zn-ribbon protein involved in translation (DUF1610 family)|nr:hypothetical protein [Herbinix sp.]